MFFRRSNPGLTYAAHQQCAEVTASWKRPESRILVRTPGSWFHLALMLIGMLTTCNLVGVTTAVGQDKQDMPWFDAEAGQPKPYGLRERADSSDSDRATIPRWVPPPKTESNNSNNTNNTATPTATPAVNSANLGSLLSIMTWSAAVLAAILVLGLLFWMFARRRRERSADEQLLPQRSRAESIKQLPFEMPDEDSGDFGALAYQRYQQGDLRNAMILLFSHVLVSLDQKGLVQLKKGKTNRQYLRELDPYASLGAYFGTVMVRFEEAFFGDHDIERSEFESCWQGLESFQQGLEKTQIRTDG